MQLVAQLADTITTAPTLAALDELARLTWRGRADGLYADADAERLQTAVEARRAALKGIAATRASQPLHGRPSARNRQASPARRKSIARRRQLAASGTVPGRIAADFTTSEVAALTVIAREVKRRGRCALPVDAIAAMAGTCRTVVQNALRLARQLRLVHVIERRVSGNRNLPNVVNVICRDWRRWLRLRRVGSEKPAPRSNGEIPRDSTGGENSAQQLAFAVCSRHTRAKSDNSDPQPCTTSP